GGQQGCRCSEKRHRHWARQPITLRASDGIRRRRFRLSARLLDAPNEITAKARWVRWRENDRSSRGHDDGQRVDLPVRTVRSRRAERPRPDCAYVVARPAKATDLAERTDSLTAIDTVDLFEWDALARPGPVN